MKMYISVTKNALIVVKYRMVIGNADVPYSDACRAMSIVKDNAEVWNINPNDIGVMGSSAGGHLLVKWLVKRLFSSI